MKMYKCVANVAMTAMLYDTDVRISWSPRRREDLSIFILIKRGFQSLS